jgi:alpha-1,6-mannosyltransferase
VNTVSDRNIRLAGQNRGLVWTATACITVSLLVMIAISVAGPSVSVPAMPHTTGAPPWWVYVGLPNDFALFSLWGAAVVAAVGVGAGLIAVARGARPRPRTLLIASFIVVAVFTVLPPAGTTDTQSYAIDGNMLVLGHSPYVDTPQQAARLGDKLAENSPNTWVNTLSDYGPLATGEEWLSAELGGSSMAAISFWLKLWVSLAFCAVSLLFDRLLRGDPAMRLRALLLWALNPLLIWEIVASGHIDGLAIAFGVGGLMALRFTAPDKAATIRRCVIAGVLLGAAAAIKSPFVLFALGAAWAMRRKPSAIAILAAGWLAAVIPGYVIAGLPAVKVLFNRGTQATWDNLYQIFYRPFGVAGPFGATYIPSHLDIIAGVLTVAVAVLVLLRMPDRAPGLPAVTPALALALAWTLFWPYQRPWYDVMIIAPLVLYQRSWLDWLVLVRLCFGAITYMEATAVSHFSWVQHAQFFEGEWITAGVRMLTAGALLWMCISGRWGAEPSEPPVAVTPPVLQPQT